MNGAHFLINSLADPNEKAHQETSFKKTIHK
jgi:hypothetical protein